MGDAEFPSAAACLASDLPALTVRLAYPLRLKKRLGRPASYPPSLEEVLRRTKVIGRFPGETSCLTMAWPVMDLILARDATSGRRACCILMPTLNCLRPVLNVLAVHSQHSGPLSTLDQNRSSTVF